jgi:outer membrane protein assembly factor BamA
MIPHSILRYRAIPLETRRWIVAIAFAALAQVVSGVSPTAAQDANGEAPKSVLIPIPILFYTPETALGFGAALNYIYHAPGSTIEDRPSSFDATIIFTTRSQALAALGANHYWDEERHNASGSLVYRKFPNVFYGIGNDTSTEGEDYTDEGPGASLDYLFRIVSGLRVGGGLVFGSSSITETESDFYLAKGTITGSNGGQASGAGLRLNFDSRNNITYPTSGGFYDIAWRVYGSAVGGDFEFNSITMDLRQYLPLGERNLIALRAIGSSTGGNVPFQLMPTLGGQNLMRGYFAGRFRDHKSIAAQGELRLGLWRRLGGAVFGSIGQVAASEENIAADRLHYSYGLGLRILLVRQEGLNLRFDWGVGEDQSGFYFSLGEAF